MVYKPQVEPVSSINTTSVKMKLFLSEVSHGLNMSIQAVWFKNSFLQETCISNYSTRGGGGSGVGVG